MKNIAINTASLSRIWLCLLMLAASLFAVPTQANETLTPHTAEYKVKISVVSGRLRTRLQASGEGYIATHSIKPTGLSKLIARGHIAEASEFAVGTDGVVPAAYQSDDTLAKEDVSAEINFDWAANTASGTVNGEAVLTELEGMTYDRISVQYALMHDLINDQLDTNYRMFEIDKLKTLNVRSIGNKRIKVPAGTYDAIGIQHQAENSSRVTTLWCVEELDFLPVVIEQHRKGKLRVRATLKDYTAGS